MSSRSFLPQSCLFPRFFSARPAFFFLSLVKHILFPVFMFHPLFVVSFHVGAGDPVVVSDSLLEFLLELLNHFLSLSLPLIRTTLLLSSIWRDYNSIYEPFVIPLRVLSFLSRDIPFIYSEKQNKKVIFLQNKITSYSTFQLYKNSKQYETSNLSPSKRLLFESPL